MELEKAIQQKKFQNEHHKAVINIIYTANWINLINAQALKPFGITLPQFNVLRILRGQYPKPATVSLIQERMLDKNSNASRLVDKLILKALVNRKECPNDRRQVEILITKKGLELLSELDKQMNKASKRFSNISEKEAQIINAILDKMRDR